MALPGLTFLDAVDKVAFVAFLLNLIVYGFTTFIVQVAFSVSPPV